MTKEGAVAWTRFMLHCLTVAMLAFGIASAPLYAVAPAGDVPAGVQSHHKRMDQVAQGSPDHDHVSPVKPHAMGQTCCHSGCIMAVVPAFASLTPAPLPWTILAIPGDQGAVSIPPLGLDRPPKPA